MTVSFEWDLHNTLRHLEAIPEDLPAVEEDKAEKEEEEEGEQQPGRGEGDSPKEPPLPERGYMVDAEFVEKLEQGDTQESPTSQPLCHSEVLTVSADRSTLCLGHNRSNSTSDSEVHYDTVEPKIKDCSSEALDTGDITCYDDAATWSTFGVRVEAQVQEEGDTREKPPHNYQTHLPNFLQKADGLFSQTHSTGTESFGEDDSVTVTTFLPQLALNSSHSMHATPPLPATSTLQPQPAVSNPHLTLTQPPLPATNMALQLPWSGLRRGLPEEPLQQLYPQDSDPVYDVPRIVVESGLRDSSSPDSDLPPTWIERSTTSSDVVYFPLHRAGSGLMASQAKQPTLQPKIERYGKIFDGDVHETLC